MMLMLELFSFTSSFQPIVTHIIIHIMIEQKRQTDCFSGSFIEVELTDRILSEHIFLPLSLSFLLLCFLRYTTSTLITFLHVLYSRLWYCFCSCCLLLSVSPHVMTLTVLFLPSKSTKCDFVNPLLNLDPLEAIMTLYHLKITKGQMGGTENWRFGGKKRLSGSLSRMSGKNSKTWRNSFFPLASNQIKADCVFYSWKLSKHHILQEISQRKERNK